MADLTPISQVAKPDRLARKSSDGKTTLQKSSGPSGLPQWVVLLTQMAQDKRHDLAPGILRHWREKLSQYDDGEILDGLGLYSGEYFPSVDAVIAIIERKRLAVSDEHRLGEWDRWKAEQARAESEGRMATPEQKKELLENIRKAVFGEKEAEVKA